MSPWKLLKPNNFWLFHFNPVISVAEAAAAGEFLCFAVWDVSFRLLLTEEDGIVKWCLKKFFRLLHSDYYFSEQDFILFLSGALIPNTFPSHNSWCLDLKGPEMPKQLNDFNLQIGQQLHWT